MATPASFRKDLKLYPGPKEPSGAPTYNLYDPLSAKYYKLGWEESFIYKLAKTGMSYASIAEEVNKNATFQIEEEDVVHFYRQSAFLGLLDLPKSSEQVMKTFETNKGNALWWVLMHYLYFRIPIFKPDSFLEKTLPYVKFLWSKQAVALYVFATVFGLIAIFTNWDAYIRTFTYFFSFEGALMYAATISVLKIIHEFSHAYTAKNYHIQVSSMGAAIIVLWPVLYTDVTDSWKLANRKERLAISIAGVTSELVIAGLSTLGWALSPPGVLQSIFFLLSSTTWISSLFINFNPAMRFDGYYILCDLWGIDNLRQLAFAVTRWKIHEWLFGFNIPCPEEGLTQKRVRGMCVYSLFTWSYLLTVYTLIATFVYYEFAKALGITLFLLEIAIFFVWPLVYEFQGLYRLRAHFRLNLRTIITLSLSFLALAWLVIPLPRREHVPAITIPQDEQVLYVVEEGKIKNIFFKQGDFVAAGKTIIQMEQEKLEKAGLLKMEEKKLLDRLIEISSLDIDETAVIPQKRAELLSLIDQIQEIDASREYLNIRARISGKLFALDDTLRPGQWISKNQVLGKIADTEKVSIATYIPENLLGEIHPGQKVEFILPYSSTKYPGIVQEIDPVPVSKLEYPSLGSKYKGPLAVTIDKSNNTMKLIDSYYKAQINLEVTEDHPLQFGKIGSALLLTPPESMLMRGARYLYGLVMQESAL